tara:strand:- start:2201 stop:2815 length:615 start_codon:yes stop_codon:yes gene_type:complete
MINALQLVSLSDFILAIQCVFLAGIIFGKIKSHLSSAGMLGYFLFFAGLSAFMGGIDHGFFEPVNQRYYPRTFTYLFVAAATFFIFKYTIVTFTKGKIRSFLTGIAYIQLIAFVISSFYYHNFILVVGNYSPVLLFFFIMNLINLKKGKSERYFSIFCSIMIIATLIQVSEINLSELVNSDTLFHVIAFIGYFFMFTGIKQIKE